MPPLLGKTRAQKSDVNRIAKKDTGTADKPQMESSRMGATRVKSGGVSTDNQQGQKVSSRVKGQRVRGAPAL